MWLSILAGVVSLAVLCAVASWLLSLLARRMGIEDVWRPVETRWDNGLSEAAAEQLYQLVTEPEQEGSDPRGHPRP